MRGRAGDEQVGGVRVVGAEGQRGPVEAGDAHAGALGDRGRRRVVPLVLPARVQVGVDEAVDESRVDAMIDALDEISGRAAPAMAAA